MKDKRIAVLGAGHMGCALLRGILDEENLRGGWDVRASSGDPRRVHLLVARGEIELASLAISGAAPKP